MKSLILFCIAALCGCSTLTRSHLATRLEQFGPSDFYLNLFYAGNTTLGCLKLAGVSNSHALFIDAHGDVENHQFRFFPDPSLKLHTYGGYNIGQIARIFTPEQRLSIHKVFVSSCNSAGRFDSRQVVKHFPNVTAVVYAPPHELGWEEAFQDAIFLPPWHPRKIKYVHWKTLEKSPTGGPEYLRMVPYYVDLYHPGEAEPYETTFADGTVLRPEL